jgi:anti-anti-sigma factor
MQAAREVRVPRLSAVSDPTALGSRAGPSPFLCTLNTGGTRAAWVHVAGELDLVTSRELERTLREAQLHARLIVLDARGVTFIDSSGVHVILDASAAAEWGGARLMLVPGPAVDRMLRVSQVRGQVWTFELDVPAPASELRLVPELPAA